MNRSKKRPTSPAQAAASRANGSKSNGPSTPAGKARAASNRVIHGFRSQTVALHTEDHDDYTAHLNAYLQRYNPQDKPEADLVGLAASSMWQIMRMTAIEAALFDLQICGIEDEIRRDYTLLDEYGRLALAFKKSAGDNCMELLRRYKASADRAYHRAFEALQQIQANRAEKPTPQETAPEEKTTVQTRETPQPAHPPIVNPSKTTLISLTPPEEPVSKDLDPPLAA